MAARCIFPSFIKSVVSNAKEENVVKPPHIPTFRNNTVLGFRKSVFIANAVTIPIRKEPTIFIISVLIGNTHPSFNGIIPIKYLQTAPINPPVPTTIHSIMTLPGHNNPVCNGRCNVLAESKAPASENPPGIRPLLRIPSPPPHSFP